MTDSRVNVEPHHNISLSVHFTIHGCKWFVFITKIILKIKLTKKPERSLKKKSMGYFELN